MNFLACWGQTEPERLQQSVCCPLLLLPTEGEIRVDGERAFTEKSPAEDERLSVITQEYSMRQDMTMDEIMEYQGRLYLYADQKNPGSVQKNCWNFCGLIDYPQKDSPKAVRWHETKADGLPCSVDRTGDSAAG